MQTLQESIITVARSYVGQKEKAGNRGFQDALFEQKMKLVGFQFGWAWCALATELILREAASLVGMEPLRRLLAENFSAGAIQNLTNFKGLPYFTIYRKLVGFTPKPGDVVVWQKGASTMGHMGIVVAVEPNGYFRSVEGNTSAGGINNRDGDVVAEKRHLLGQAYKPNGLNIIGFIRITQ